MDPAETILLALARDPGDDTGWLALADCLAERGEEERAELVRLQLLLRRRLDGPEWPAWQRRMAELWDAGVPPCQPVLQGPAGIEFVLIPPGTFWMGAADGERWMDRDELPRRQVTLTRGFWLTRTPVTNRQWREFFEPHRRTSASPNHPVVNVTHAQSRRFCLRLGTALGRRCRLPSEAEWEYACRAGTSTAYCSGDDVEGLRRVGWCSYSGEWDGTGGPVAVGTLRPNAWGLQDMHGNVWEWCLDWYDDQYHASGVTTDPTGPPGGNGRVMRGGSWRGGPWFCRSAKRRALSPSVREVNVGFRVAMEVS